MLDTEDSQDREGFDVEKVLNPIEVSEFFDEYWEQTPLVVKRDQPDYYKRLLSLRDVDKIISSTDLRHPTISMAKEGPRLPISHYTYDIPVSNGTFESVADADEVYKHYQDGASIILQAIDRWWKPLHDLVKNMEYFFHHNFHTNVYLTPENSQGFDPHYDTHDVFILQISGIKHWCIYEPSISLPHQSQPFNHDSKDKGERGKVLHEFDLEPGQLIYIPRGYVHEAAASDSDSLHITLGLDAYTWVDAFQETVAQCIKDPRFRESLPVGFMEGEPSDNMNERFRSLLESFTRNADLEEVAERIEERFISNKKPMLDGHLSEVRNIKKVTINTTVQRKTKTFYKIIKENNTVSILFNGKKLSFPTYVETALRFICDQDQFTVKQIPSQLDNSGKVVLVRRLIKEGFITNVQTNGKDA